jgi:hypothetical protein
LPIGQSCEICTSCSSGARAVKASMNPFGAQATPPM